MTTPIIPSIPGVRGDPDPTAPPVRALPVRVEAVPGEALDSFVSRVAAANQIPRKLLWDGDPAARPTTAELERVAALTGLEAAAVAQMNVFCYPEEVVGIGRLRCGGWMLHRPTWACPTCTPRAGVVLRDWAMALHPICRTCRCLLTTDPQQPVIDAPAELVEVVDRLAERLKAAMTDVGARSYLADLRRHATLVAQTITTDWPLPHTDAEDALRNQATQTTRWARGWGRHPAADPLTASCVLLALAHADEPDPRTGRLWLTYDGYARLADQPFSDSSTAPSVDAVDDVPPGGPARCPARYLPTPVTRKDAEQIALMQMMRRRTGPHPHRLLEDLTAVAATHDVFPHHVPALAHLPEDGDQLLPGRAQWTRRARTAHALHELLVLVMGQPEPPLADEPAWPRRSLLAEDLTGGTRIDPDDAHLLQAALHALADRSSGPEARVSYQRRRDLLRARPTIPQRLLDRLRLPETETPVARLAAGWVWVHLTRGPTWASADPELPTPAVLAFHRTLDPETRLALHDHGLAVLDDADTLDPAHPSAPTRPRVPVEIPSARTSA